jgi:hypothetical protein
MVRLIRLFLFLAVLAPAAALAGPIPPPGPQAAAACSGGNSVIGFVTQGLPLVCGTALSSGSIGNGTNNNVGYYIGLNSIGDSGVAIGSLAPLLSPTFTGTPAAPTPTAGDNTTKIATTAFVKEQGYLTGNQTITLSGGCSGSGATSIACILANPSPSSLGGIESAAAVTHQWINQISTSGVPGFAQPACSDLSGVAPSCSTDTTNASNINSGMLNAARITHSGTGTTMASVHGALTPGDCLEIDPAGSGDLIDSGSPCGSGPPGTHYTLYNTNGKMALNGGGFVLLNTN